MCWSVSLIYFSQKSSNVEHRQFSNDDEDDADVKLSPLPYESDHLPTEMETKPIVDRKQLGKGNTGTMKRKRDNAIGDVGDVFDAANGTDIDPRHVKMISLLGSNRKVEKRKALQALQIHARVPEFSRTFPLSFSTRLVIAFGIIIISTIILIILLLLFLLFLLKTKNHERKKF